MNINQIRYFIAAFELGSFSAAARAHFVTVQAVSKAVTELEREAGMPLFTRESRCVRPTEFGRRFHSKAMPALCAFEDLEAFVANGGTDPASGRVLRILLCTPPFHDHEHFVEKLSHIIGQYLRTSVEISLSSLSEGIGALERGAVDGLATIGSLDRPGITCTPVGTVATGVTMAYDHPLASQDTVTIDDLKPYRIVMSHEFDDLNESILTIYRKRGLESPLVYGDGAEDFDAKRFLLEEHGLVFSAAIPSLVVGVPYLVIKLIDDEVRRIPVCISTLENASSPEHQVLMRFMKNPLGPLEIGSI